MPAPHAPICGYPSLARSWQMIEPEVTVHINAHRAGLVLGVLMAVQYGELRGTAQGFPTVRVIPEEAKVFARPEIISEVVTVTHAGEVLHLIDKRQGWYWILLGRDANGSRQPGWIQANQVAIATAPTSRDSLRTLHEELAALPTYDSRKVEREKARRAAAEARAEARIEEAARNESLKAERENARRAAVDARAAARIERAARDVEEARRTYENLKKKAE